MVARLAKAASADYYVHSQASFRPPDEYYLSGEEPDGVWWNPSALFSDDEESLVHGARIDSGAFYRLYNGFHPQTGDKLTQNAGSPKRCPAYDLTFNADKTVSALWAIAPPELRAEIETAHNDAVRAALEDTIQKYCGFTRTRDKDRTLHIVPADILAAQFQHGASRTNDPHLHTHCVILNVARSHHDGKWRALHGNPLFSWPKAAGAAYRAELAWLMRTRLGFEMETHGDEHELTRIKGVPEALITEWSKRGVEMHDAAARFGMSIKGNRGLNDAILRATRASKQHGVDPETRHANWREEATAHFEDLDLAVQSLTGHEFHLTDDHKEEIERRIEEIPANLSDKEAVFKYTHVFEKTFNATAGLLPREERQALLEKVLESQEIVELDRPATQYDAGTLLPHARTFTSAHNLHTEKKINELSADLIAADGFGLSDEAVNGKIEALKADDYPTSDEQIKAIRAATRPGRIAIIEGAAGSGKTTTLRPIADLYREHGYHVIATAVPWAVTLELGTDLDAPNWCVDKLIAMNATGRLNIDANTVVFVDEAGMLASSQALKILQIARSSGAKIVFTGDTQQQQPVQAGPGLRLIRDVASSTRIDTIRRQKPDMEDILIAVHGEDEKGARLRAMSATDDEKQAILDEYEAIPDDMKPAIRPWQVVASEHFRDGEAAAGIAAYHRRGRFHIERNLEDTLARLVDDWHRFQIEQPDKTSAVIAYSNAEVRALSFLIRERVLKDSDGPAYTVQACRGRSPKARPEPLEIAVGDRLRAGALNWSRQIFNGTYMTVLELEQRKSEDPDDTTPRLWIRARTDRGRIVEFHHDEIRDYHGKVRLDHGYAMTMTSAQGLTVDRAFVFANQKPARETIYPAFTRHRERLDVYIDRKPVELDVRQQRDEETAGDPVTDTEVREYLARNWSRERPKEAAKDYMSDKMRETHFENRAADALPTRSRTDPEGRGAAQWLRANDAGDGKLADVAERIRYSEIRVRNGLAAETIGRACRTLNASLERWDEERSRAGNTVVAIDPAFRKDLRESGAILRTIAPFLRGDPLHARLLRERGGIDVSDLQTLAKRHTRARSIRTMSLEERRDSGLLYNDVPPAKDPAAAVLSILDRDFEALRPQREIASTPIHETREDAAARQLELDLDAVEPPERTTEIQFQSQPVVPLDLPPGYPPDSTLGPPPDTTPDFGPDEIYLDADYSHDPDWQPHTPPELAPTPTEEIARPLDRAASPDPEPDPAPSPSELLHEHTARIASHLDAADEAGLHPFDLDGWEALETGLRSFVDVPGLDKHDRDDVRDSLRHIDAKHEQRRGEKETARNSELVRQHRDRIGHHVEAARDAGVHIFDLPGWAGLEATLRQLQTLPGLAPRDLENIQEDIDRIDAHHRHRFWSREVRVDLDPDRTPEQHIEDYRRRRDENDRLAQRFNYQPHEMPGWTGLENHLKTFAVHPAFSAEQREFARQELDRAAAAREAHRIAEIAERERQEAAARQARQDAEAAYNRHLERRRAHFDAIRHDRSNPAGFATPAVWKDMTLEGLAIAEMPGLPDEARSHLGKLYDDSMFNPNAEQHREAGRDDSARKSRTAVRGDSYAQFAADIRQHAADAKTAHRNPSAAPGWTELMERCNDLLRSGNLTRDQQTRLEAIQETHRKLEARRNETRQNEIAEPLQRSRGKSRGMSF